MSFSDSKSYVSSRSLQETNSSVSIIQRHPTAEGFCSEEIRAKQLPDIKETRKYAKEKICCSPPHKPEVTLPKLKLAKIPSQRFASGEPLSRYVPEYYARGTDSSLKVEESIPFEPLPWDSASDSMGAEANELGESQEQDTGILSSNLQAKLQEVMQNINKPEAKWGEESKALKRWEYWMADKKKIQNYLSKKVKRNPFDLMLQESDKFREVCQRRIMRCAALSRTKRQSGGHLRLHLNIPGKIQQPRDAVSKYEKSKTGDDEPLDLEYVIIPDPIKIEKGFLNKNLKCKEIETLKFRKMNSKKKFFPKIPEKEVENLVVIGSQIKEKKSENVNVFPINELPEIIISEFEKSDSTYSDRESVFCLVICDEEIKYLLKSKSRQDFDKKFAWQVDFGVNTAGSIVEKVLRIENRGTTAVSYNWFSPKTKGKLSLNGLEKNRQEPWFFFNRNSGIFLPGQIYDIKIYLRAKTSGIRKEIWCLTTEPPLPSSQGFGTVTVSAVATEEISKEEKPIEIYLKKRVAESIIAFIMQIIISKVFRISEDLQPIEYRSILCDKILFEYHNPKHYYHSDIVKELQTLFKQIPGNNQTVWDLSLDTLLNLMKTHKMGKEKNTCCSEIAAKAKKLLRPNYFPEKSTKKYRMTYSILCKMTNSMEEDYDYLRSLVSEKRKTHLRKGGSSEGAACSVYSGEQEEQIGEFDYSEFLDEIRPINYVFFQAVFYLKVYHRICEAVESIVGVLETAKLFEPWRKVHYKLEKPSLKK